MNTIVEYTADFNIDEEIQFPNSGLIVKQVAVDLLFTSETMEVDHATLMCCAEVCMDKDGKIRVTIEEEKLPGVHVYTLPPSLICAHYAPEVSNQYWHKIAVGKQWETYLKNWPPMTENLYFAPEKATDIERVF